MADTSSVEISWYLCGNHKAHAFRGTARRSLCGCMGREDEDKKLELKDLLIVWSCARCRRLAGLKDYKWQSEVGR